MNTKQLTHIAFLACIMMVAYLSFSSVLYLEILTFTALVIAVCLPLKESLMASFIFGLLMILLQGIFPWTVMYLVIFPVYVFFAYHLRKLLFLQSWLPVLINFLYSFLLGQLLDLPFLLFSKEATYLYWLMGIKTSLIQGCLSAAIAAFLFEPVCDRINKILGGKR